MARIIDSVLVDDDRGDQSTELDQHMPVAAIAGETRGLDRKHRADVSGADCADQTIKAGAGDACAYRLCHPNVVPMETAEPSE